MDPLFQWRVIPPRRLRHDGLEIYSRQQWFSSRLIHTVGTGFTLPLAQAGVTTGMLRNRLSQAVHGTMMPLEGLIWRVVVQMLRTWWIMVERVEKPS